MELAERMLDPRNPLPARVMVNRVWQHLFGRGIVASVDNFGVLGQQPTDPALLDYLADSFRRNGWSVKRLIREIMLSQRLPDVEPAKPRRPTSAIRRICCCTIARCGDWKAEAIRDAMLAFPGGWMRRCSVRSVPVFLTPFMEGRGRPNGGPLGRRRPAEHLHLDAAGIFFRR